MISFLLNYFLTNKYGKVMTTPVQRNIVQHQLPILAHADVALSSFDFSQEISYASPQEVEDVVDLAQRKSQRIKQIILGMVTASHIKSTLQARLGGEYKPAPDIDLSLTKRQFDASVKQWRRDLHSLDSLSFQRNERAESHLKNIQGDISGYILSLNLAESLTADLLQNIQESVRTVFSESDGNSQRSSSQSSDGSSGGAKRLSSGSITPTISESDSDWEEIRQAINAVIAN